MFSIKCLVFIKSKIITKKQLLSVDSKKKGYERAKLLLRKLLDDTQATVLPTDEKFSIFQAIHISQVYKILTKNNKSVPAELRAPFTRHTSALFRV